MVFPPIAGLPIILVAFLGGWIHKLVPNICSFTDFTNRRFGPVVQASCAADLPVVKQQSLPLLGRQCLRTAC